MVKFCIYHGLSGVIPIATNRLILTEFGVVNQLVPLFFIVFVILLYIDGVQSSDLKPITKGLSYFCHHALFVLSQAYA